MPNNVANISISGLRAQSERMGDIADNVANASTPYYKRKEHIFQTFVTSAERPGGVLTSYRQNISQQGVPLTTDSQYDLSIGGDGFYVLSQSGDAVGSDFVYSRGAKFQPDEDGNLRTPDGFFLRGWRVDQTGTPTQTNPSDLTQMSVINVSEFQGSSSPTSALGIKLNLPANAATASVQEVNTTIYDSLGIGHSAKLEFTKTGTERQWEMRFSVTGLTADDVTLHSQASSNPQTPVLVEFNADGTFSQITDGGGGNALTTGNMPIDVINLPNGAATLNFNFSLTNSTLSQNGTEYRLFDVSQDGIGVGSFTGVDIDEEGLISAVFDTGQVRKLYKLSLVDFVNPNGLQALTGNVYLPSLDSGNAVVVAANSSGVGKVLSSVVEASTADIASEFTSMVQTQQFYVANTKVIKVNSEMDRETTEIIR